MIDRYEPAGPAVHAALVTLYDEISRRVVELGGDVGLGPSRR